MAVLLTGGAGYVGAHCARLLLEAGEEVLLLDDLRSGHRAQALAPLVEAAISAPGELDRIFSGRRIDAVMHLAASIEAGESVLDPAKYYRNNFGETLALVEAMLRHGVRRLVFSSTAAVYGEPQELPIPETHPTAPLNPYGHSKRMAEQLLFDAEAAHGLRTVCLRYFNAAGADPGGQIGERHEPESHLIPCVMEAAYRGAPPLPVFGRDYPTPDGTCIRDYVHVTDIARAHLLALAYLRGDSAGQGQTEGQVFNIGSEQGHSVLEVLEAAERLTGRAVPRVFRDRRAGDSARLVASAAKIRRHLGWRPQFTLDDILSSAWRWRRELGDSYHLARAHQATPR